MGRKPVDVTGVRSGALVAKHITSQRIGKYAAWVAQCDCGKQTLVKGSMILSGSVRSCGCANSQGNETHGHSYSPTYQSWRAMRERVDNANNSHYKNYGGRGITYTAGWKNFSAFLLDMGERPPGMTLDRADVNKNYSKENCRWASSKEQSRNTTRTRRITHAGQTKPLVWWAEQLGITQSALSKRLDRMSQTEALSLRKNYHLESKHE